MVKRIKKGEHFIIPAGYGSVKLEGAMEVIASMCIIWGLIKYRGTDPY